MTVMPNEEDFVSEQVPEVSAIHDVRADLRKLVETQESARLLPRGVEAVP